MVNKNIQRDIIYRWISTRKDGTNTTTNLSNNLRKMSCNIMFHNIIWNEDCIILMHDELSYVDSHNNVIYHAMITVIDGASHDILIITLNHMIYNIIMWINVI